MRHSVLALFLLACAARAGGPRPIAWDREACAHCHMLVGDPRTAAQIDLGDGEALSFDDPGCLFAYLEAHHPQGATLWFHHRSQERWLRGDAVAFVDGRTPMGYGKVAVDPGERP